MCGIIGYVGKKDVVPILVDGLKRLEYRGMILRESLSSVTAPSR